MLAQRCLDQIAGVDLNPYATAIARFRLIISALRACQITRLAEAPAFRLHLATGDSLLHGPLPTDGATIFFDANRLSQNVAHVYDTEDAAELKEILGRGYHAVVGNPPYIAVQDAALRDAYRSRYASCHGKYVLTVPFMERFFELGQISDEDGRKAGFVGKITGNSFMRREFGAPLVEKLLPSVDVEIVIDASGAYIPGHGTPTILLFGRSRRPVAKTLRVVDGIRGEPKQPEDPARGLVWSAIEMIVDQPGEQDRFVRCSTIERAELFAHPMTLGVGRGLRTRIEKADRRISAISESVGITSFTLEDDLFLAPDDYMTRRGIELSRPIIEGDGVRDWVANAPNSAVFPYDDSLVPVAPDPDAAWWRHLWRARTNLARNVMFGGKTKAETGLAWYEFGRLTASKLRTPLSITWGEVATHNHFVLASGGKVFNRTAPVIKLPEEATEEQHLALLGVLNSSVACFWLKQVCHNKGSTVDSQGARQRTAPFEDFFQYNATKVKDLPLPPGLVAELAAALDRLAGEHASLLDDAGSPPENLSLAEHLSELQHRDTELTARIVSLQEELDWRALRAYGLAPGDLATLGQEAPPLMLGQRAFEIVLAREVAAGETETTWFARHGSTPITAVSADWPADYRDVVERRIALIESDPDVGLIERPESKRRWNRALWEDRRREVLTTLVLEALEDRDLWTDLRPRSTAELTDALRKDPVMVQTLELLAGQKDADVASTVRRLVLAAAVPHLAAQRLTDKGLRKREIWECVWDHQRAEDRGETVESIPIPPKYAQADFRSATFWKHRGKLDVPKERFVLIPNSERGADSSPVVGWAGWNERDRGRALAGRVTELRQEHAADAEQLIPLLAGMLELLPWIHQWHPEPDPLFGGPPGAFFESWLDGELAALGTTRDTLRAWRPPAPTRGRKTKASTA